MNRTSASPPSPNVPALLAELEQALGAVHQALLERDGAALELHCAAVQRFMSAALAQGRQGGLDAEQRRRLARVGAQLAAQRSSLARASTALDRALDVLMPAEPMGLYGQSGRALKRRSSGGAISA